jgi:hypothetical protein
MHSRFDFGMEMLHVMFFPDMRGARQTDDICTDFEKRLKAIVLSTNGVGGTGCGPADSTLAACTVTQAQTGSLILTATGALQGCSHLLTVQRCAPANTRRPMPRRGAAKCSWPRR